jgi:hypothetical protein
VAPATSGPFNGRAVSIASSDEFTNTLDSVDPRLTLKAGPRVADSENGFLPRD